MAASQKKKQQTKGKKNTGKTQSAPQRRKSTSAAALPPQRTYSREIGGAVCLLVALCVCVSYFSADAFFLAVFVTLLRGALGCGYWISGPVLAVMGVNLLFHRKRPVVLRTVCALLLAVSVGALGHLLLCQTTYQLGTKLFFQLWKAGQTTLCGGAVAGGLAVLLTAGFGKIVSSVLLVLVLIAALFGTFHISPEVVADRMREQHEQHQVRRAERLSAREAEAAAVAAWEGTPSQEPVRRRGRSGRPVIDIPLDDEPTSLPAAEKAAPAVSLPRRKGFFTRKSDDIRTPDQVLTGERAAAATAPVTPVAAAPVAAPVPAPAPKPVVVPAPVTVAPMGEENPVSAAAEPEKAERSKKAISAQEVEEAAEEVSRAIEDELAEDGEAYHYPPLTLLDENHSDNNMEVGAELRSNSSRLANTLQSFGVDAQAGDVVHGPSVTRYEFTLDQGVKLSKITNLSDDIALALGASGVRIAPVPNKISAVGIEVPNRAVTAVRIRDVIESRNFRDHTSPVAFAVGKDIGGNCVVGNLASLPHVLIAGTTGSGKSVCTNSLIVSMLYRSTPEEVRFIMVDPKMVELAPYNGIPHLLIPVVTDPKKAAGALQWAVFEMMKRYKLFSENGVKDLAGYNALSENDPEKKKLPNVVVVIDELADLMLVAAKEVEESICRVAQMGRAAGMHLVIATQRPSSDVITGLMKANIPSRIAFAVASSLESRIILDTQGAEKLVGKGDMLYFPLGAGKPNRVQGCFITPEEIERVVAFVKETGEADYSEEVMEKIEETIRKDEKGSSKGADVASDNDCDELFPAAVEVVLETGQASVSMLQRRLKLGYSRAARLVDQMEEHGIVGPFEGSKPRQLLIDRAKWQELQMSKAEPEPTFDRSGSISDVFESHDALD